MGNKLNRNSRPQDFTVRLAVLDMFPVLFFIGISIILGIAFKNIFLILGCLVCIIGGLLKIIWKFIVAIKKENIWPLSLQFRYSLPAGFLLMAIGIHQTRNSIVWTYVWNWIFKIPVCIFLYIGLVCIIAMLVLAFLLDSAKKINNYIEQLINIVLQFNIFLIVLSLAYFCDFYHAKESIYEYSRIFSSVTINDDEDYISITKEGATVGFIFYPGAKVEPSSYIPLLEGLAYDGIDCYIARMPYNFALFNINSASDIIAANDNKYSEWYIGGHSLGGAMAATYAAGNVSKLSGLVLFAAYSTDDLTESGLKVLSIYGEDDGVLNMSNYKKYISNLPEDFIEYKIPGGNHAMFGDYGPQSGDNPGTISATEAWSEIQAQILKFIKQ